MKIDLIEINKIIKLLDASLRDPLKKFVSEGERTRLKIIQKINLDNLFSTARQFDIRFLYIGKGEISGCEDKREKTGAWPAIWKIADIMGLNGSCGNHDQYQTPDRSGICFPADSYGGWDLKENRKLTDKETKEKKFCRVVTRE